MCVLYYLFKDAQPKSAEEEVEVRLLEGWVWLATRSKGDTEQALSRFMEMATSLVSYVIHTMQIVCVECVCDMSRMRV